jgi:hypothetical protein
MRIEAAFSKGELFEFRSPYNKPPLPGEYARNTMNTERQRAILHYGRTLVRKRRGMDKKGLAVALIFLIALCLWAWWRAHSSSG